MARPKRGHEKLPPDELLPALLIEHGSFVAVARRFGVARSTVGERYRRLGLRSPDRHAASPVHVGRWGVRARSLSGQLKRVGWTTRALLLAIAIALLVGLVGGFIGRTVAESGQRIAIPSTRWVAPGTPWPDQLDVLPAHVAGPVGTPTPSRRPASGGQGRWRSIYATWYGPGLYGGHTADGSVLRRDSVWVAMNGVALGTWIELRYRGRTLVVQVRDRHGHTAPGHDFIDMTEATAEALGWRSGSIEWRLAP